MTKLSGWRRRLLEVESNIEHDSEQGQLNRIFSMCGLPVRFYERFKVIGDYIFQVRDPRSVAIDPNGDLVRDNVRNYDGMYVIRYAKDGRRFVELFEPYGIRIPQNASRLNSLLSEMDKRIAEHEASLTDWVDADGEIHQNITEADDD